MMQSAAAPKRNVFRAYSPCNRRLRGTFDAGGSFKTYSSFTSEINLGSTRINILRMRSFLRFFTKMDIDSGSHRNATGTRTMRKKDPLNIARHPAGESKATDSR